LFFLATSRLKKSSGRRIWPIDIKSDQSTNLY
jgi:hypothetical protein